MRLDDGISFWIERHGADGRPVSSIARPARRIAFSRAEGQGMSGGQNRVIAPCVALSGADVTNGAVTVVDVVPAREASGPGADLVEIGKALGGEFRPILGGAKQRLSRGRAAPPAKADRRLEALVARLDFALNAWPFAVKRSWMLRGYVPGQQGTLLIVPCFRQLTILLFI